MLSIIADNPKLYEELTKLLDDAFTINYELPTIEKLDDKALGEMTRARITGLKILKQAYTQILSHKTLSEIPRGINPAR